VSSDVKVSLGLPILITKGDSRFASIGDPGLPKEATPGLPMMVKKKVIYY
jgi:hypothetical protein